MEYIHVKKLTTPLDEEKVASLHSGDRVLLTGTILTARDAAHRRMVEELSRRGKCGVNLQNEIIYYVGPTGSTAGRPIGSAGPTSSYRMDSYTATLLDHGLKGMIGKGERSKEYIELLKQKKAIYFVATGGAGALLSLHIKKSEIIEYADLGTEAIRMLEVEDFPLMVAYDSFGNDLFTNNRKLYERSAKR